MAPGDGKDREDWDGATLAADVARAAEGTTTAVVEDGDLVGGRFQLLGVVGVGGMGTVYRVRDVELDEIIALKMLRSDLVESAAMLERFRREVKLARRVTHRNVARTFDIGEHGARKFLTMEFVEGESLAAVLARDGAMSPARVIEVLQPICAGLAAAHAAGVIHRDLKPDNVLVALDGRVVITDFGIAAARAVSGSGAGSGGGPDSIHDAALTGTPAYMAPEQVEGGVVDARSDIYALGAMCYELLTGKRPFRGATSLDIAMARLKGPAPDPLAMRPGIPAELGSIVRRCLERRPAHRFQTVDDLAAAVAAAAATISGVPSVAPATPVVRATAPKTVAVLPFENTGSTDDDYLAVGFTDDVIDRLSGTRGIRVRSRGAVMRYRGFEGDPRDLGKELDVQLVVHGTVQRRDGAVRITARLTSVADGFQVWARRFDRPAAELLTIVDEATRALAESLTAPEPDGGGNVLRDPVAVDLYLRGRYEYHKLSPVAAERAVSLLEQAAARAPDDPAVLSSYALALARAWNFDLESDRLRERATSVALRAAAVAPQRGEPHLALAFVRKLGGDWVGMARALRDALAHAPELVDAIELHGGVLLEIGDERGVAELERALKLDPQLIQPIAALARHHELAGDAAGADELITRLGAVYRGLLFETSRARLLLWRRDVAAATLALARLAEGPAAFMPRYLLQATLGRPLSDQDSDFVRQATDTGVPRRRAFFYQLEAEVMTMQGDHAAGLRAVKGAVDQGLIDLPWLEGCPLLAPLRDAPAFATERRRVEERVLALRAAMGT